MTTLELERKVYSSKIGELARESIADLAIILSAIEFFTHGIRWNEIEVNELDRECISKIIF